MSLTKISDLTQTEKYLGGENFNLRDIFLKGRKLSFFDRVDFFSNYVSTLVQNRQNLYMRAVNSAADREVEIVDPYTNKTKKMLMFGSNNYLGLANHPYVKEQVEKTMNKYGVGIGGPPLLNGYTMLHHELEERLAGFKHKESAMIFSTGYGANVGLITGLVNKNDLVIYDEYSHASFCDGIKMGAVNSCRFKHNNVIELSSILAQNPVVSGSDRFVGVEGVYSMDGDLSPLDKIVPICKSHGAILLVDDAHGTGVIGKSGSGTPEHFGVEKEVDIVMGTFSKTLGVVGGFVCASKPIIDYLRYFARSYMFSASLPPIVVAAALAGLDIIQQNPELIKQLHSNVKYAIDGLAKIGLSVNPEAAIIALRVPETMNIRKAVYRFHELGIFVNSVEYPAVPLSQQRFRISIMATHTKEDIDRLVECVEAVWDKCNSENLICLEAA